MVYVGIEDPDPTVDRKGMKYLQDNGIEIDMFPRELQKVIREANKEFLGQATQRATEAEEGIKPVKLSGLEDAQPEAFTDLLFDNALERFREKAEVTDAITSPPFSQRLKSMGLLEVVDGKIQPTGYGLILFGEEPEASLPQARLLATIHYSNGTEETNDFGGPLILVPDKVEKWLEDKLSSTIDRSQMHRREVTALPMAVMREGIINALVHRDYDIEGAKCHLVITPDVITIKSPGGPLPPITLEQLNSFRAPMLSRNPRIQFVFNQMGLSEERGLGMKTLKELQDKHGLPLPRYNFEEPYLELTIFRHAEANLPVGQDGDPLVLSDIELAAWKVISSKLELFSTTELTKDLNVKRRTIQRILARFSKEGLVNPIGSGRSLMYKLLK